MQIENRVLENFDAVVKKVERACLKSASKFSDINILTVTKYALVPDILTLLANRKISCVAESRLQDSIKKWSEPQIQDFKVKKFFIGQLQTNKAAKVLEYFDVICSLDSNHLASCINVQAGKLLKCPECLVQVKLTDRETQGGVDLKSAQGLITEVRNRYKNINLKGIMAIAPVADNPEDLRLLFKQVKQLFDDNFNHEDYLSLGMSHDFEVAVEEGSNLPRIGSAIFH